MKKIINSTALLLALFASCTSKKEEKAPNKSNQEILEAVSEVHAIGKITSAEDWAVVAAGAQGIIQKIMVGEGETVRAGQTLLMLEADNAQLDVAQAGTQLNSLKAEYNAQQQELNKARILAAEWKKKYETSKALFDKKAETEEKVNADYSTWQQNEASVKGLSQKLAALQAKMQEQNIQLRKTQNVNSDYQIKAARSGVLLDFAAKVGQMVTAAEELGKIYNLDSLIVQAEVDELFANDVKQGQQVQIFPLGRKDIYLNGKVAYVAPILSNKSILYETANEGEDRRVRQIKISIEDSKGWSVNAKVECIIQLK
ncbi:MAG TPA: efflux RND transporter periplasmic adaptor subunit [Edaphocola sp.]|nr:efflux RND transporter periplasmic adaptor subunit [Edaphocola sp.]